MTNIALDGHMTDEGLIKRTVTYVKDYMSNFDPSHDFSHIKRVVSHARTIEISQRNLFPTLQISSTTVILAALLHDVGDRKYVKPGEDSKTMVEQALLSFGADSTLAHMIQEIVNNVSYNGEKQNPELVHQMVQKYPELAIVQDADRLDALGAIGIARTFTYNASKKAPSMQMPVDHMNDKLILLEGSMKTRKGREMAVERTQLIRTFQESWQKEMDCQHVGETEIDRYL